MQYRVHGIGRKLGTEISATVHASSREDAQRIAEATMIVSSIDEPEDPLDIGPVTVNETPNVGAIAYAAPPERLAPPDDYPGILVGSWVMRGVAGLCCIAALVNFGHGVERVFVSPAYLFSALMWMVTAVLLYFMTLIGLAIREIAINSRVSRREN